MIPTIETIVEDVTACRIDKSLAVSWLYQHAAGAIGELRDAFAMAALQGIMTHDVKVKDRELIAADAYLMADAMLKERTAK